MLKSEFMQGTKRGTESQKSKLYDYLEQIYSDTALAKSHIYAIAEIIIAIHMREDGVIWNRDLQALLNESLSDIMKTFNLD